MPRSMSDDEAYSEIRKKYLSDLHKHTCGRNIFTYYSGWTQHPELEGDYGINETDKTAFMTLSQGLGS